jgi:large subunit ribosomal protein L33
MAKSGDVRVTITLECTSCTQDSVYKIFPGISRYMTQKNRLNTPIRLESNKFCLYCYKHTIHREIKKKD